MAFKFLILILWYFNFAVRLNFFPKFPDCTEKVSKDISWFLVKRTENFLISRFFKRNSPIFLDFPKSSYRVYNIMSLWHILSSLHQYVLHNLFEMLHNHRYGTLLIVYFHLSMILLSRLYQHYFQTWYFFKAHQFF